MIVLKFGGTSVSSEENLIKIESILKEKNENYIVVVSAFSGITNLLEEVSIQSLENKYDSFLGEFKDIHTKIVKKIFQVSNQTQALILIQEKCNELEAICKSIYTLKELSNRTKAKVLSFGEQLSSIILHQYFVSKGIQIEYSDSRDLIITSRDYLNAEVNFTKTYRNIQEKIRTKNYIAPGFIARNENGETTTLGRGGSDYTAAIFASAINASLLEIWSDVNGIHNANPSKVKNTNTIQSISYQEAFELAYFGAKVLHPPTVLPVMTKNIPIHLKNTLHPEENGTVISRNHIDEENKITGVSSLNDIALITISGVGLARQKGRARKVFQILEENEVNAILITQSCSEQSIGIGIQQLDLGKAKTAIDKTFEREIELGIINPVHSIEHQCIIALVGDNMKHKVGLSGKVFGALGENGINVTAIAQGGSERNISIVIHQKDEKKALNVVHEEFFNDAVKNIHLFVAGVGNVGKEFIKILDAQNQWLRKNQRINLKLVGIANSKKYEIDTDNSLTIENVNNLNESGTNYDSLSEYLNRIKTLNLRNSIFVDNTASETVSNAYEFLLKESVSVVACNKIACSSDYNHYSNLMNLAKEYNCDIKYETTVGAALPVIKTIQDLVLSGDKINKIDAVLSGSLNFIFNQYNGKTPFAQIVKSALVEGYTEPNPMIDLSGLDVMRKILILSREAGYVKELSDIDFQSFLPKSINESDDKETLFQKLSDSENHFHELYNTAQQKGNKLKVVASFDDGKMSVSLQEIPPQSPFYNLEGKDNVVALYTNRYSTEPMVIKGAGAGAAVTASGVFADIMSIVNQKK